MMVIRGATRPDAHAADIMSVVIRQGRSLIFHLTSLGGVVRGLVCPFRVMAVGFGEGWKASLPSI